MDKVKVLFHYGLLLFAFFPIIPNKIKGLPVIILFILAIILFFVKKEFKVNFKKIILYSSLYLLYLFSLFFTTNFDEIDKTLSTRLSILIFPLIFGLSNITITKRQLLIFLQTYFVVSIVYCGLIILYFYKIGFLVENIDIDLYYSHLTNEMWNINQHPIYASIFMAIGVIFGIKLIFLSKNTIHRLGIVVGLIFLFSMLLFLSRKSVILALCLIAMIYSFYHLKNRIKKRYLFGALIVMSLMLLLVPITQKRFKEIFDLNSYSQLENTNSTSIRFEIYKCVIENIQEKPIFGHGIGDVKNELNNCYSSVSPILLKNTYNSHNQYLSILLGTGIVGLTIFLFFLFLNFRMAIYQKMPLFLILLVFFCTVMLFENILERQSGVILFSLVINFFAFIDVEKDINKT